MSKKGKGKKNQNRSTPAKGGLSLQQQLQQAGLVSDKQVKKAQKIAHRTDMQRKQGTLEEDERLAAIQSLQEKAKRDKALNLAQEQARQSQALTAQIKQLIKSHSQRQQGDIEYNFTEDRKIRRLWISADNQRQLNRGHLAIVKIDEQYDLVPEKVARRIMDRTDGIVMYLYERDQSTVDEDDPYKDYPIPDDLDW